MNTTENEKRAGLLKGLGYRVADDNRAGMTYRLVQMVEGRMVKTEFQGDNVFPAMDVRGFEFSGINQRPGMRKELDGAPIFVGLLGPMWDGDAVRYETQEVYNILSA